MEPTRVVRMLWCCCGSVLIVNYGALQRTKLTLWTVENSTNEELLWIYDISLWTDEVVQGPIGTIIIFRQCVSHIFYKKNHSILSKRHFFCDIPHFVSFFNGNFQLPIQ